MRVTHLTGTLRSIPVTPPLAPSAAGLICNPELALQLGQILLGCRKTDQGAPLKDRRLMATDCAYLPIVAISGSAPLHNGSEASSFRVSSLSSGQTWFANAIE